MEISEKTRKIKEPFIMHPLNKRLKSLVYELNFANKIEFVNLKKKLIKQLFGISSFNLFLK